MALRKGFVLAWQKGFRLLTLDAEDGTAMLPIFTGDALDHWVRGRVPVEPHDVLLALEVWADLSGGLKHATAGGGLKDLSLDWSRLRPMWDTDPGFRQLLEAGLARLGSRHARSARPDDTG